MNKTDAALINILVKDGRASFADIARQLGISRAHARTRVQSLVDSGVIALFSAVINPEKLGKVISTFIECHRLHSFSVRGRRQVEAPQGPPVPPAPVAAPASHPAAPRWP